MNIFELIATMATAVRNLDSRITYAPLHLRDNGSAHLVLACKDDDAVRDLARIFEMPAPSLRTHDTGNGSVTTWIGSALASGLLEVEVYGPHTQHAATSAVTAQQGA